MPDHSPLRDRETLETITGLLSGGVTRMAVLMRHSARNYTDDTALEPFMGLTDQGKDLSFDFGSRLPVVPEPAFFSSHFGRCIETACLVDKGYLLQHGRRTRHNRLEKTLSPFYVRDIDRTVKKVVEQGSEAFLRDWFDRKLDNTVMMDPEETTAALETFLVDRITGLEGPGIAICVTHDWNLFPLRELRFGLKHETIGRVGYLESLIAFEKDGRHFLTSHRTDPVPLP